MEFEVYVEVFGPRSSQNTTFSAGLSLAARLLGVCLSYFAAVPSTMTKQPQKGRAHHHRQARLGVVAAAGTWSLHPQPQALVGAQTGSASRLFISESVL